MTENMRRFLESVSADRELMEKICKSDKETLVAMAKELGIELTDADFEKNAPQPMSDDELDAVAGGKACHCVVGGGGEANQLDKTCACVMGGGGESRDGKTRCVCVLSGAGDGHIML